MQHFPLPTTHKKKWTPKINLGVQVYQSEKTNRYSQTLYIVCLSFLSTKYSFFGGRWTYHHIVANLS